MKQFLFATLILFGSAASIADSKNLVHMIRFTDYEVGSEEDWLLTKGFQLKQDMKNRKRIDLEIGDDGLVVQAKKNSLGIMINETINISEFTSVEVDWGVNRFPKGASYEQDVRNEALMLIVFMGDERLPSGSMFIPDSPFFIGIFLCDGDDRLNYPYKGAFFKKGGRYVCVDKPDVSEKRTSSFDLLKAYRKYYDKDNDDDPGISGIAIALDTKKAKDGGKSSAFLQEIRFYK